MKLFFITAFCLFTGIVSAQNFTITGTLKDTSNVALEAATVYLETVSDSTLITYTITDRDGFFRLDGSSSEKKVNLFVSYTGYSTIKKELSLTEPVIDLGNIVMKPARNVLGAIMITANEAPIVIKSDTLQFNAASFNTRPDANLEALLEKLPGVQVDDQGNITVNGKPVSQILVNGEEFFGGDTKIATKNLPKEIIDKIQVVNTKTEAEAFTGEAGSPTDKTINVVLKEDMDKGYFSRLTAGGGTDERYKLSGIANYFNGDLRISVLASANNINTPGFSMDEMFDMLGHNAFSIMNNFNNGITKSKMAGLSFANKWNETTELGLNYFFARSDTKKRTTIQRENILPDGRFFINKSKASDVQNDSHRASLSFEIEPDTLTRISVRPSFNVNSGFSSRNSAAESINQEGNRVNVSETSSHSENYNATFSNRLDFIRKFGSRGAYLEFEFSNENMVSNADNFFFSQRTIDPNTPSEDTKIQNQLISQEKKENEYEFEIKQRSVLAKDFFLDLSYEFEIQNGDNKRMVYDFSNTTEDYTNFDPSLSNKFKYSSFTHIPNVGLSYEGEKWRASFDTGLLSTQLKSENNIDNTSFDNTYNNLYLRARVRYKLKKSANLYLYYRNGTDIPSLQQLQPVTDRTNPLHLVTGNPKLKPEFDQRIRFGLRNYDFSTRSGYYLYSSMNFIHDAVVPITTTDENLIRKTTYTNVDGTYRFGLGGHYNKRLKKEKRIFSYSIGAYNSFNNSVGFSNGEKYESQSYRFSPRISVGYEIEELFSISPSYNLSYYINQYDIFQDREENYANHSIGLEATTYWPKNVVFETDISYNYYGNVSGDFDPSSVLWNTSLGYKFLNDDATIALKVYDLLNQNISTRRSTGDDYVQTTKSLVLQQYFMLSFTWKFTKFGGKGKDDKHIFIYR